MESKFRDSYAPLSSDITCFKCHSPLPSSAALELHLRDCDGDEEADYQARFLLGHAEASSYARQEHYFIARGGTTGDRGRRRRRGGTGAVSRPLPTTTTAIATSPPSPPPSTVSTASTPAQQRGRGRGRGRERGYRGGQSSTGLPGGWARNGRPQPTNSRITPMSQSTIMHRHWEVPREEDQPKCTKCHISFQTVNELAFHFQQSDAHPGCGGGLRSPETTFVCSTCCGRRFDDLEALQKHRWERKKVGEDERASRFAEKTGKRDWRRAWEDGQGARGFVRQSREQEEESEGEGGLGSAGFGGYEIGEGKGKYAGVYDYYDCEEDDAKRIGRTREPAQTVITKQDLDAVADIMKRMGLE